MDNSLEFWFSALDWDALTPPRPWPSPLKKTIFPPCPPWLERDALQRLKRDRKVLMERGRVVPGAIVQANYGLYDPRADELPADVVWSEDPFFRKNPLELMVVARRVRALKGKNGFETEKQELADLMTNEFSRPFSHPIPADLCEGRQVFLNAFLAWRAHLPSGILGGGLLPFLVLPEVTPCVILLPSCFWPDVLKDA